MQTTTFVAPDIECDGCANSIKNALGKIPGVESVAVDVPTKAIYVTHAQEVSEATLVQKLDRAGFPVTG